MEERAWFRPHKSGDMQFFATASSRGRSWAGFDAAIFDTSGGFAERLLFAKHYVSMHVGAPVPAACRCDGPVLRHFQIPGDIDVIPAGFSAAREDDGPTTMLVVNVDPSLVKTTAEGMGMNPDRAQILPQLQIRDPQVEHIAWALKAELEAPDSFDRLYAESLGSALTAHLLRRYAPLVRGSLRPRLSPRKLQRVFDYIQDNLASDLSLVELAKISGVGASHFKSLFKRATGTPVHQYVIQCRVERAVNLLSRSETRLSEVALQAGFFDQSHMARCMRRVIGVTPAVVMRRYQ